MRKPRKVFLTTAQNHTQALGWHGGCDRFEWDRERGEATEEARRRQEQWRDLKVADLQLEQSLGRYPAPAPAPATTEAGSKTSRHKLKQMKSSANKKMSSLKSQITDIYRYAKIV